MSVNKEVVNSVMKTFIQQYGNEPRVFRSPGRVNLIGEHTDYNGGFVLPAAINKAIYVAVSPRDDRQVRLYSDEFHTSFEAHLDRLEPVAEGWPNYILGVASVMQDRGHLLQGVDLVIGGDVPIGSGLSSSAAVECATGFALNELFQLGIDRLELALIAQKAEHSFAKVMCGIMDQFASVFGKKDHLVQLDCRDLSYTYVPFDLADYKILLLNSNVKHALADTEYNTRRQQCEQGVAWVREAGFYADTLRDVTLQQLEDYVRPKHELIFRRCRYVLMENERLLQSCGHLENGDLAELGKKMFESHEGLSKEYEVSCRELDFLVECVRTNDSVLGARMMGGGFGGCTINLVKADAIDEVIQATSEAYTSSLGCTLTPYVATTENGSGEVSLSE